MDDQQGPYKQDPGVCQQMPVPLKSANGGSHLGYQLGHTPRKDAKTSHNRPWTTTSKE